MPTLGEIFNDPRKTSRDPTVLAKRAGTTVKSAKAFLRDQGVAQLRQRAVKPSSDSYAPTGGEYGTWLGDVVYLKDYAGVNDKRSCLLVLMEVNSRYVYVRAMTSPTAKNTAAAMAEILRQNIVDVGNGVAPINEIRTDVGSEFLGEFTRLLESQGIALTHPEAYTHERIARLDRFVRTLRGLIGAFFDASGSHRYIDALPDLIANYNESPHRGLLPAGKSLSPAEINPALEQKLREYDLSRARAVKARTDQSGIMPGSQVRLLVKRTKAYQKQEGKFGKSHLAILYDNFWAVKVSVLSP
jgi:hypothetical protein